MKKKTCDFCFNEAVYSSGNTHLYLCEDCYCTMSDDYSDDTFYETGVDFDEFYDICEIDDAYLGG